MTQIPRTVDAVVMIVSPKYKFLTDLFRNNASYLPFAKSKVIFNSFSFSGGTDANSTQSISSLIAKYQTKPILKLLGITFENRDEDINSLNLT